MSILQLLQTPILGASFSAQVRVEAMDSKSEPGLQPLGILRSVDLICHLWQQYVNTALLPLTSSSVTVRREMVVFNNQSVSRLEGGTNLLLQRIIDGASPCYYPIMTKAESNTFFSGYWVVNYPTYQTEAK